MKNILDIYFHIKNKIETEPQFRTFRYHGWMHTKSFYDAVCYLAALEDINDHDTLMLKVAALFHDTGYIYGKSENHEIASAAIAHIELQQFGFPENDIDQISRLIVSTMTSYKPVNILEEIMQDADLEYIGRDYYPYVAELLRIEMNFPSISTWKKQQLIFLERHRFITESAQKLFNRQKDINIKMLKEKINQTNKK